MTLQAPKRGGWKREELFEFWIWLRGKLRIFYEMRIQAKGKGGGGGWLWE